MNHASLCLLISMIIETNSHIGIASTQFSYQCLFKWSCKENQQASDPKQF